MRRILRNAVTRLPGLRRMVGAGRTPHGAEGVLRVGHRAYVGGLWEELGLLQFDFLVARGLRPHHVLLDIACGSLRAGVHLIPYLEPGHYLGIDKEAALIRAGVEHELPRDVLERKRPQLIVSSTFEFERFLRRPDHALAQSLFTHVPAPVIELCLRKLREVVAPGGLFYATYFETRWGFVNPARAHDFGYFAYTRGRMEELGGRTGWSTEHLGDWGHPRGQKMIAYRPA